MEDRLSRKGLFHLFLVYILWSTTYLAMRLGVGFSSGFPPFIFGALRMPIAALILLAMARARGLPLIPAKGEWKSIFVVGNLLWLGGNGSILWAAQYADSGFTCLMASSAPVWAAGIELVVYKRRPSLLLVLSLLVGFAGIAVLASSMPWKKGPEDVSVIMALAVAPMSWALGSVIQSRRPVKLEPLVASGYQHLSAAVGFTVVFLLLGEPAPHPTVQAWIAWAYLVVFGSILAFTSYVTALKHLPIHVVMTFAYVNPVLAVFLGWLLLDEPVTARVVGGAALVLLSVFAVFNVRRGQSGASG